MTPSFAATLDRSAVIRAVDALTPLVEASPVAGAWDRESALPGLRVGGLTRHLVSQPECAVEFLTAPVPAGASTVGLLDYFDRVDWLLAGVEDPENTSIRDDFNDLAAGGPQESVAVLDAARAALPGALAVAGPTTYVPWQDCALATDDFLVCRLVEIVVHADDLAASLGLPVPEFDLPVVEPVVTLLAALSLRRRGQTALVRALARSERASGSVSAF